ncbi:bifunctional UDP-N-acetylglucosamine diphosphorylase/glucosamine-1-phosphate N-acetyltransferase GlmU [Miniphocaeibacter halophilus]|uniref:Bifunctional UDP-N-acetylglucosamine diphosphorylase/glucosamine-1-phosphate N-acetyltransferase GlmU n=1 Tax=Miniphocaeibacter halophilus TaxID=2931922 RepID=A0AC61MSQ9_9FIRM|nr:bifunctional UDP-N-acetylglucosamine diphosphorylase/glucosamine-1-phosphate N-acetyltransferase GlmU [Miniphocaeibacter halophilus]QQK08601.1 bifunctional UDP-N-acetylglucosamine diphosphorylase/glucosamine-1-phosphate N-acetyltransferase GlmU [Miniphocaeibacter halophilus]
MNICIILAAGEGTRMKSKNSKVLHKLMNKSMIEYVLNASDSVNVGKKIIIAGKNKNDLENILSDTDVIIKEQKIGKEYPYGTGYAVSLALDEIDNNDNVLILTGDTPLIKGQTLKEFMDFHNKNNNIATVLTANIEDPTGYGRIIKDHNGNLIKIVEHKDCTEEELKIKEFNSGFIVINGKALKNSINKLDQDNIQGEMYLTDIFEIIREEGDKISTFLIDDVEEVYGINSKLQLSIAQEVLRKRINSYHMSNGVIMENPNNIFIEDSVIIGKDSEIRSGVRITGNTIIGEDCLIYGDTVIDNTKIGNNVTIKSSTIENSEIGDGTDIGPYAHIRPNSKLGKNIHIGNFVEVKNSNIDNGTKAGHLAYIGDGDLGKDVNIACGVIFANYDGKFKHRTRIGDNAFIGSNVNLVAPLTVEKKGYVAAGSTITKDVREGELSVERAEQRNISGWVKKKEERDSRK